MHSALRFLRINRPPPAYWLLAICYWLCAPAPARAFPPAPHHLFYGMVRDEWGNPLETNGAEVILHTDAGVQIRAKVAVQGLDAGVNYRLAIPMDAGVTSDLYRPTALRPTVPFKIRVKVGNVVYLPIEMKGNYAAMGQPGKNTHLDLTLGEDADGDGLPDAWERALMQQYGGGLGDIRPGDDSDGDGMSNLSEYISGTYAFDDEDGYALKLVGLETGKSVVEFTAIRGRTYSIQGSADLKQWSALPFRVSGGAGDQDEYRATDVRVIRAEIPESAITSETRFFKLMIR